VEQQAKEREAQLHNLVREIAATMLGVPIGLVLASEHAARRRGLLLG